MRKPANTRAAKKLVSLALAVAMIMCGISGIFSAASAEGEVFTITDVASAAKTVYEAGKTSGFAASMTINGVEMDQPTYFILACKAILNIDNNETVSYTGDKTLENKTMLPHTGAGQTDLDTLPATVTTMDKQYYVYIAERQTSFALGLVNAENKDRPGNWTTLNDLGGRAGYDRCLAVVLAALASYADTNELPASVDASFPAPQATPTPPSTPIAVDGKFSLTDVVNAADAAYTAYGTSNEMASTYTISGTEMNKASFFNLMALAIVNINAGSTADVDYRKLTEPSGVTDTFKNADDSEATTVSKAAYVSAATRMSTYAATNGMPPNFASFNKEGNAPSTGITDYVGEFTYQRAAVVFARILSQYKANSALPESVDAAYTEPVKTPVPTKTPEKTFTLTQVVDAMSGAYAEFLEKGAMPETVTIDSTAMNQASYFRLAAHTIAYTLGEGQEGDLPYYTCTNPDLSGVPSQDGFKTTASISKAAYIYAAQRQLIYMDDPEKGNGTPAKVVTFPGSYKGTENYQGQLTYERMLVLFARVLSSYKTNSALPDNADLFMTIAIEFTLDQIIAAAPALLTQYDADNTILTTLNINGTPTSRGQYFKLLAQAISNINAGDTTTVYTLDTEAETPDGNGIDTFAPGETDEITKQGYLFAIEKELTFMKTSKAPSKYVTFSDEDPYNYEGAERGQLTYQNQILIYARVLQYYKENNALPEKVSSEFTLPVTEIKVPFATALDTVIKADQYYNTNNALAQVITMNIGEGDEVVEYKLTQASVLKMAALLIQAIEAGNTTGEISFTTTYNPDNPANDTFNSATVTKAAYLHVANSQLAFMADAEKSPTGKPSNYTDFAAYTGEEGYEGFFSMNRAFVVLARVLAYYKENNKLPDEIDASYKPAEASGLELVEGSTYAINATEKLLTNVGASTKASDVIAAFKSGTIQITKADGTTVLGADEIVGTGMIVQLMDGTTVKESLTVVVPMDVNGDGAVNSRDIAAIQRHILTENLNGARIFAADPNGDGNVNSRDIAATQRKIISG